MAAPVYFYYQLANFYQNHRRYVKSRSDGQLRGDLSADTSYANRKKEREVKKEGALRFAGYRLVH